MMFKRNLLFAALVMVLSLIFTVPVVAQDDENQSSWQIGTVNLVAPLLDPSGNQVGTVGVGDEDGLGVMIIISGLPAGEHGMHLHEAGVCAAADDKDFGAAGGHFNPGGMSHPNHAGDLGNITIDENGNAMIMAVFGVATYDDGAWGLADKDGTGTPQKYHYPKRTDTGKLYLDVVPDTANSLIINHQQPLEIISATTDEFDCDQSWYLAMLFNVAYLCTGPFAVPLDKTVDIKNKAIETLKAVDSSSPDDGDLCMRPARR